MGAQQTFANKCPHLLDEWDNLKNRKINIFPDKIAPFSNKKVHWLCPDYQHSYEAFVYSRARGSGCPYCSGNKVLKNFNDLAFKYPDIALDFDLIKNNPIKPDQIMWSTGNRYWWKCHICGHEWQTRVNNRTSQKQGCPECYKRNKFVSLFDICSELRDEFDYTKNTIDPNELTPSSTIPIIWNCRFGHSFTEQPYNRHYKKIKRMCSQCYEEDLEKVSKILMKPRHTGKHILSENTLASKYPNVLTFYNYDKNIIKPSKISATTNDSYWFQCPDCGNEWKDKVINLVHRKSNPCPKCNEYMNLDDSLIVFPEFERLFDADVNGFSFSELPLHRKESINWKCVDRGHPFKRTLKLMRRHTSCPICSGYQIMPHVNDFATRFPEIAKDYDSNSNIMSPYTLAPYSSVMVHWKCFRCAFEWNSRLIDRTYGRQQCHRCSKKRVSEYYNFAVEYNDTLLKEYSKKNTINPYTITSGSNKKILWDCFICGREYECRMYSRTHLGINCSCQSPNKVIAETSIAALSPELYDMYDEKLNDRHVTEIGPHSRFNCHWICDKGHRFTKPAEWLTQRKNKCPICNNSICVKGENDLLSQRPKIAARFDLDKNTKHADQIIYCSTKKYYFLCNNLKYKHSFLISPQELFENNTICPICNGVRKETLKMKKMKKKYATSL